ncbi:16S rRNA (uracil(1498)-N(3))-methyltransferase [Aurantiacibacter sediminis]|uniref:Ribosomal RNA small subunit methyltransferase E n=1 Tax=Aurantiacibacter sediminis TaxID=2793064 RepID=A0ABS0N2B9_9SPHN|nr:16S rRNA (uracil(1498)-N(3))-methyltransferase [Aurantiacibacter sediminis]MBH5322111.1 16S rRNA (uracil(1498)-N(3))-methyltransferase [Aurantiacibacter sediminis]
MPATHDPKTPAWPPRSAPRLFVDTPLGEGQSLSLEGQQAHYLARVMRLDRGDAVILCDNRTGEWVAEVTDPGKRAIALGVKEMLRPRENVPDLWLCPALLKKDRFDLVLEKATELGVSAIHPVITRRCVADKLNLDRAERIVTEAAEQCARTALPEIAQPLRIEDFLRELPADRRLFFADEMGGEPAVRAFTPDAAPAAILTGPEGGFDDAERKAIRSHPNAKPISLGPRILRGETAAMAAVSLWMGAAGDW